MSVLDVELLVLNYNGRHLLAECLPSIVAAAGASRHHTRVTVIDNDSRDDSRAWLTAQWPRVRVVSAANDGLSSFNAVVAASSARVAVLLNNDVRLEVDSLDGWVAPLLGATDTSDRWWGAAPCLWRAADAGYEGERTAVGWRWGLVEASCRFPGYLRGLNRSGVTASAGAALAVVRDKFVALGGFERRYFPGTLEDLDLAFRAYCAGWELAYVPQAQGWHHGQATFGPAFGPQGCAALALRNTLVFHWTRLRHPWHVARHLAGLAARLARDLLAAPRVPRSERWPTWRAIRAAWRRCRECRSAAATATVALSPSQWHREREFFRRYAPRAMALEPGAQIEAWPPAGPLVSSSTLSAEVPPPIPTSAATSPVQALSAS